MAGDESPTTERPRGGRKGSHSLFAFACHRCGDALLFPINNDLKKKWIIAIKRKDWEPSKWSRLCSTHFKEEDIDRTLIRVQLKENVVPSIFPAIAPPPQVRRCPSSKRKYKEEISIPSTSSQDSPQKQELRKKLKVAEEKVDVYKKKVKNLSQIKRRLSKKNADLEAILKVLREKFNVQESKKKL
ncbi:hypothetical protein J6590_107735 [Homalodisca vitripennis]|nr:hypothetical protein J6590_107735 [Homalodisca vitripennis]